MCIRDSRRGCRQPRLVVGARDGGHGEGSRGDEIDANDAKLPLRQPLHPPEPVRSQMDWAPVQCFLIRRGLAQAAPHKDNAAEEAAHSPKRGERPCGYPSTPKVIRRRTAMWRIENEPSYGQCCYEAQVDGVQSEAFTPLICLGYLLGVALEPFFAVAREDLRTCRRHETCRDREPNLALRGPDTQ